jgi:hypothetical protein
MHKALLIACPENNVQWVVSLAFEGKEAVLFANKTKTTNSPGQVQHSLLG